MKLIIPVIFFLFMAGCSGNRNHNSKTTGSDHSENKNPEFEFTEEIHNFGTRKSGEILVYTFVYRNSGQGKLEIGKTESGCSCLEIHPDKLALEPGETGKINVIFNTSGLFGEQFQAFRIMTVPGTVWKDLAVSAAIINENIQFQ